MYDPTDDIEKTYKLSDGKVFHFHSNDEGWYYAIYNSEGEEIDGGLLEYSDDEILAGIKARLAEYTSFDELMNDLEEMSDDEFEDFIR